MATKKYNELEEKTCEVCGNKCRGRKVCPSCCAKKNGFTRTTIKYPTQHTGIDVQAIFDLGLKIWLNGGK